MRAALVIDRIIKPASAAEWRGAGLSGRVSQRPGRSDPWLRVNRLELECTLADISGAEGATGPTLVGAPARAPKQSSAGLELPLKLGYKFASNQTGWLALIDTLAEGDARPVEA